MKAHLVHAENTDENWETEDRHAMRDIVICDKSCLGQRTKLTQCGILGVHHACRSGIPRGIRRDHKTILLIHDY